MKELSRRVMSTSNEDIACGTVSVYAVEAEIVVEDNGQKVYLHTEWVDAASDDILFEATSRSIYDFSERINSLKDFDTPEFNRIIEERNKARYDYEMHGLDIRKRYAKQYKQLVSLMQELIDHDGIEFNIRSTEEE